MRVNTRALLAATAVMLIVVIPSVAWAQHKHTQSTRKESGKPGMSAEMAKMMKSPHHVLMTAHMNSMSEFARALRDQAVKPESLDVEFARRCCRAKTLPRCNGSHPPKTHAGDEP